MRDTQFVNGEYYHVFNRGVDKRKIFLLYGHYVRFTRTIKNILNTGSATERHICNQSLALKYKVKILNYCLMPNHYHFLIQQIGDQGITVFMHNLNTSYTKYFNLNNKRSGRLFEYTFKAKLIDSDELLLHISRYIHLNPLLNGLAPSLDLYPWSSYLDYINPIRKTFCDTQNILQNFDNQIEKFREFTESQINYGKLLKEAEYSKDEDALYI